MKREEKKRKEKRKEKKNPESSQKVPDILVRAG